MNYLTRSKRELLDWAGDIEKEELTMRREHQVDDDNDGWVDEVAEFAETEKAELKESVRPVSHVLVKVCTKTHCESLLMQRPSFERCPSS